MSAFLDSLRSGRPKGRRIFIAALALALLQTVILVYMVIGHAAILRSGAQVLLKAAPVDPRDLLRGDYVILNYDISNVPLDTLTGARPQGGGEQRLWVRLKKQADGYWGIAESSFGPLPAETGSVVLVSLPFDYRPSSDATAIRVSYGIESYYVPEGEGHSIEQAPAQGRLAIEASVSAGGTAQIRSLLLDGKPVYEEPFY